MRFTLISQPRFVLIVPSQTTTTTTRTDKDGKQHVEVSTAAGEPGKSNIQEMPGDTIQRSNSNINNGEPTRPSPTPIPPQAQSTNTPPPQAQRVSPDFQPRNPNRLSRDTVDNPVSPVDRSTNFSYPSRSNLRDPENETTQPQHRSSGRLENLKAAAMGLHVCSRKHPVTSVGHILT